MGTRPRIILPLVMGIVNLPLVLWDIHNAHVIQSMGMAWDTGAPIWPYQTSDILLRLLNAPAYSIAVPIANLSGLAAPAHLFLVVPAILIWWSFLGFALDRGSARWPVLGMFVVLAALLLWAAVATPSVFRLRLSYQAFGLSTTLVILRVLTPAAWFTALTGLTLMQAKRVMFAS